MQLSYLSAISGGKGEITENTFKEELIKEFGASKITDDTISKSEDGMTWIVTIDDVSENFKATQSVPEVASKLTDEEKNSLTENGIAEITGNSISNNNLKNNDRIKAVITGNVPLTSEMTYITGTVDTGIVISIDGNEFVWVPVPNVICTDTSLIPTTDINLANATDAYTPMAKLQSGSSTDYEGLLYSFSGTTSTYRPNSTVATTRYTYREPAYLSGSNYDDNATYGGLFNSNDLQTAYNNMVKSVNKYGGFYVSRYELGLEGTTPVSKPTSATVTSIYTGSNATNVWYELYTKSKSMYPESSNSNIISTMIWGSQYDAMMNWMAKNGISVGDGDNTKRNQSQSTGIKANQYEDKINNIFDLYGCHYEFTLEAYHTEYRASRGGSYGYSAAPAARDSSSPNYNGDALSCRTSLYIK